MDKLLARKYYSDVNSSSTIVNLKLGSSNIALSNSLCSELASHMLMPLREPAQPIDGYQSHKL